MSHCSHRAAELLPEYVRGQLDQVSLEMVSRHLQTCAECSAQEHVIRTFVKEPLPAPDPWFFASLPGKVSALVAARRKRRWVALIPAWVGGLVVAVAGIWLALQPGLETRPVLSVRDYSLVETGDPIPLGLEEEILSVSGKAADDLDQIMFDGLGDVVPDSIVATNPIVEGDGYETMDGDTIRIFEKLLDEITPAGARKKVMS